MSETNLETMQRLVSSYDTKAGQKLRYHITRAQADKKYAEEIMFNTHFNASQTMQGLDGLFCFNDTKERHDYWWEIHSAVDDAMWKSRTR